MKLKCSTLSTRSKKMGRHIFPVLAMLFIVMIFCVSCRNRSFSGSDQNWPDGQETGLIPVDGGSVLYHYYGKDKPGIPIIFLHGGPGSDGTYFFKQIELAKDRPIVIYNQLGSAGSPFADEITNAKEAESYLTIEHFVNEVQTVRDYFGFKEFIICGRSWGTMLAVEYAAAKQPDGLKGIILSGPFLNVDRWCQDAEMLMKSLDNGDEYWRIVTECEAAGAVDSSEYTKIDRIYCDNFYSRVEGADDGTPVEEPASHVIPDLSIYNYMWGASEFSCTGTLKGHDSTALLPSIKVPVLYICGQYDYATPETAKWYLSKTPDGELCVLPGCGHNASRERPVEFNAVVSAFADRVSGN